VALRQALQEEYQYKKLIVVLGIMADKDLRSMLLKLAPLADHLILTRPKYERAAEPESLKEMTTDFAARTELIRPARDALQRAVGMANADDLVLVTGSLYFIGEIKEIQKKDSVTVPAA
jgi:dihydrofolate synthase/folylpolyglutamate synthase